MYVCVYIYIYIYIYKLYLYACMHMACYVVRWEDVVWHDDRKYNALPFEYCMVLPRITLMFTGTLKSAPLSLQ